MARPNYGPQIKQRTKRLLEALLLYANDEWETEIRLPLRTNWQTERQLVVRTKLRFLVELTAQDTYPSQLTPEQIREALKRLQDFLGILEDNRPATQGSEDWHFTLKLWHRRQDVAANLAKLDEEWERLRPLKSHQATQTSPPLPSPSSEAFVARQDWGDAPEIPPIYGRDAELTVLKDWILRDNCRLVGLLGMGGVGKTTLAVKLAEQLSGEFEAVMWRSLRNAPPADSLLVDLIRFLSTRQDVPLAETCDGQLLQLIGCLQTARRLIVLDNFESVLQGQDGTGAYRPGYEAYGQILRCLAESRHQSCLVFTSREQPLGLFSRDGSGLRSLRLQGLTYQPGQQLLTARGLTPSAQEAQVLVEQYGGNPLALRIVSTTVQELFNASIQQFLACGTPVFGDVANLIDQQFSRLSPLEQRVMEWVAVHREWVLPEEIREGLMPPTSQSELLEALLSLERRSLVEKSTSLPLADHQVRFSQQPVVMEYVVNRLIDRVYQEICTLNVSLLNYQFLVNAQAKDYLRETQIRLLLKPLATKLLETFGSRNFAQAHFSQLLAQLKATLRDRPGYAAGNLLNLLWQMGIDLKGYDFSHLAVWQVYLQGMALHEVNFAYADLTKSVFTQVLGCILSATFSPNGAYLAVGVDQAILLIQVADGRQVLNFKGHTAWVTALCFSPDGQTLASGSHDQTVRLWEVSSGACLRTLPGHSSWVQTVDFSPDGATIASAGNEAEIRLWDVQSGNCSRTLTGHASRVLSLKFHPTQPVLISSGDDRTVKLWDLQLGDCLRSLAIDVGWALGLALHPRGQEIAASQSTTVVERWDVETGDRLGTLPDYAIKVWAVDYSPDGELLATAGEDHTVRLWSTQTNQCLKALEGHSGRVWLVELSQDGHTLVSASDDQTVKLWDIRTGDCLKTIKAHSDWIVGVAASPIAPLLASGGEDQMVRLWNLETGRCDHTLSGHTNLISSVAFSPDGTWLASSSDDCTVRLWDAQTGDCRQVVMGHTDWVQSVCVSPSGQQVISGSHDKTIKLWDVATGQCLQTLQGHEGRVKAVAVSPQGGLMASGGDDHAIKLWSVETGACLATLDGHQDWVLALGFSPCGQFLASGSGDRRLKIWDAATGQCLWSQQAHGGRVRAVAFSPNGQWVASGGEDFEIKLWDVATGNCLRVLEGHSQIVWSVAFSNDGQILTSCSEDGTIRIWNSGTGDCVKVLRSCRPYEGMNITGATGLTAAQIGVLRALGAAERKR
ncbi:NB-ARC domain-containing protein [Leptolyngbya sp. CCNP1308]|uniref:WD40 domain-containing protein n=1 Tax=Leptolyngbya sp. CCNP1308 TaxID=3110255 RepID=UPI002B20237F|nr:NB-ARC domain-containing protein [Leptolyngbya sp. CCNP1308]MEA5449631.1 NB-ARC domain-containing protein [Leptolyngbya sp. CCNP1308]